MITDFNFIFTQVHQRQVPGRAAEALGQVEHELPQRVAAAEGWIPAGGRGRCARPGAGRLRPEWQPARYADGQTPTRAWVHQPAAAAAEPAAAEPARGGAPAAGQWLRRRSAGRHDDGRHAAVGAGAERRASRLSLRLISMSVAAQPLLLSAPHAH